MNAHSVFPTAAGRTLAVGLVAAVLIPSVQAAELVDGPSILPILAAGMVPAWFLVLVFGTMVAVVSVVLAAIGRLIVPKESRARLYALSPVAATLLIFAFYWVKMQVDGANHEASRASYGKAQARTAELIDLKAWWLVPDADHPQALHLEIGARASGQLAVRVLMGVQPTEPGPPPQVFLMENPDVAQPKVVKAGDSFGVDVPLLRLREGAIQAIAITLYFKDITDVPADSRGHVLDQVAKVYSNFIVDYLDQVNVVLPPAAEPKAWSR